MISDYTVLDLEMTGLTAKKDKIIEIGAVKVRDHKEVDTYAMLVNPGRAIPFQVVELTGITDEMVKDGADMDEAVKGLIDFVGDDVIVGHNVIFDYGFIKQWAVNNKIAIEYKACDTLKIARKLLPGEQPKKLEALCEYFNISRENAHRALDDTRETMEIFEALKTLAEDKAKAGELTKEKIEEIFSPYVLQYKAKKQTSATKHQLERLKRYMDEKGINDPIDFAGLTRSEASRLQDQYYAKYGK